MRVESTLWRRRVWRDARARRSMIAGELSRGHVCGAANAICCSTALLRDDRLRATEFKCVTAASSSRHRRGFIDASAPDAPLRATTRQRTDANHATFLYESRLPRFSSKDPSGLLSMPNLRWRTIPRVGDFWGVGVEPHELSSEGDPSWNSVTLRRKDARCASCTLSSSPVVLLCSRRCTSRGSDDGATVLTMSALRASAGAAVAARNHTRVEQLAGRRPLRRDQLGSSHGRVRVPRDEADDRALGAPRETRPERGPDERALIHKS